MVNSRLYLIVGLIFCSVGDVVTPAQQLMAVALVDSYLEAEVMVQSRDIGFVLVSQTR